MPICFAFDGATFFSAIDEKPKRVDASDLRRVRNIMGHPEVALLFDRYSEDWSRLGYVLVHGRASLLMPHRGSHSHAVRLLRERYPQYEAMEIERNPVIEIVPGRVTSWGAMETDTSLGPKGQ